MNIEKYLIDRVDEQIKWYDMKSLSAQHCYKTLQIIEISLASLIPLFAPYTTSHSLIAILIGCFGAAIAIIESISKLYKFHENWIQYRTTCEMLKYQKILFVTKSSPYNTSDETVENIFIRNIENIISSENNQWKSLNVEKKDAPKN